MDVASDYWKVVADALGDVSFDPHFQAEPELSSTTNRSVNSSDAERLSDLDDVISRTSVTKATIELESSNEAAAVFGVLQKLKVPLSERAHMVERIMNKACDVENKNRSRGRRKIVRMSVNIDLVVVVDDDDDDRDEDGILLCCLEGSHPYPDRSMVEQLQKTGVCPTCDDDRKVLVTRMEEEIL